MYSNQILSILIPWRTVFPLFSPFYTRFDIKTAKSFSIFHRFLFIYSSGWYSITYIFHIKYHRSDEQSKKFIFVGWIDSVVSVNRLFSNVYKYFIGFTHNNTKGWMPPSTNILFFSSLSRFIVIFQSYYYYYFAIIFGLTFFFSFNASSFLLFSIHRHRRSLDAIDQRTTMNA